ncbi:MAG: thiamine phosphate synthase [Candidatus Omnitrophica bacterium]|nr:thiamine phosphate synthase [Candidatus Omnitrophota bacterium]
MPSGPKHNTMNPDNSNLYFVTSEEHSNGRSTLEVALEAIEAGIDILQMREKGKTRDELKALGSQLLRVCREKGVKFIVNDDPFLAAELDADGVHLGQEDAEKYTIEKTREILGGEKMIGLSTHSVEQFGDANKKDIDYIAFGPIFETRTKDYHIGADNVEEVLGTAEKPVIFIGGIDMKNIDILINKGVRNIAVIRAITQAGDIGGKVREFKERISL